MVNYKDLIYCYTSFIVGYIISFLTYYVFPPVLDMFSSDYTNLVGIAYFFLVAIWIISLIVVPAYFAYRASTSTIKENNILTKTISIIFMIMGIMFTIFGWFMINGMAEALPTSMLQSIYWVGFILIWVLSIVVTPISSMAKQSTS